MKLLILICTALSIVYAQTASQPSKEETIFPHTLCILFGDKGCFAGCHILGKLYNPIGEAKGACEDSHKCACQFMQINDLDTLWKSKFKNTRISTAILQKVKRNTKLSSEVLSILEHPLFSAKEMKSHLKNALKQLSNQLEPNENQLIDQYVDDEGVILTSSLGNFENFVRHEFPKEMPPDMVTFLLENDYETEINKFLARETDEATLKSVLKQIDYSQKFTFVDSVHDYLQKHNKHPQENRPIQENDEEPYHMVEDIIAGIVIDIFMTRSDKMKGHRRFNRNFSRNRFS